MNDSSNLPKLYSKSKDQEFKDYAESWVKWTEKYKKHLKESVDAFLISKLLQYKTDHKIICDFGYGKGRIFELLKNEFSFKQIFGYEVNPYLRIDSNDNFQNLENYESLIKILKDIDFLISTSVIHLLSDDELIEFFNQLLFLKESSRIILIYPCSKQKEEYVEKDTSWYNAKELSFFRSDAYITKFIPKEFKVVFSEISACHDMIADQTVSGSYRAIELTR